MDNEIPGFGATPDGLLGDNGIVEIKCSYTIRNQHPEEAIRKGITWTKQYFDDEDPVKFKTNSAYYYQIQGQLRITQREYCILCI